MRLRTFRAQSMVEFALALPVLLALTLGSMGLAWACWQRAAVDHALTTMAEELPGGWDSMPAAELVSKLVCDDGSAGLDPARLTVSDASATTETRESTKGRGDGSFLTEERGYVRVSADVSYRVDNPLWEGLSMTVTRHVERSYLASTRTEVGT